MLLILAVLVFSWFTALVLGVKTKDVAVLLGLGLAMPALTLLVLANICGGGWP